MDAVAYKNGSKNQWRRSVWKLLKEHADPGIVLYLPGSTDLDRGEAIRRGFKPANLIAVERDADVAAHLRSKGVTTINAPLEKVIESWPVDVPVSVLLADLQCGLDPWVIDLASLCGKHPALCDAIVVANLQRGRDQAGKYLTPRREADGCLEERFQNDKGRAWAFATTCALQYHDEFIARATFIEDEKRRVLYELGVIEQKGAFTVFDMQKAFRANDQINECGDTFYRRYFRPTYFQPYRSTPHSPYFDSVAFRIFGERALKAARWLPPPQTFRPQIAAALAIRTRRLRGELHGGYHST